MVLQGSGRITLNDIAGEFGGAPPHKLSEYYSVAVGLPGSGTIRLSNFYGKSNNPDPPTWSVGTNLGLTTPSTNFSTALLAYSDSPTTLSLISGPNGFSFTPSSSGLNGSATISGTTPSSSTTLYWSVRATDQEGQTTDRTFSLRVSRTPTFSGFADLGSVNINSFFGFTISASSDSSVTYSVVNSSGYGSITSGGYLSGYAPYFATTISWTIQATDQEGQSGSAYFYLSITNPVYMTVSLAGYWNDNAGQLYINGSPLYLNESTTGYWTSGPSVGRQGFTLTVTGYNQVSMYFPDVFSTFTGYVSQNRIDQSNGTYWYR